MSNERVQMIDETWIDGDVKVSAEFATCGNCLEKPDCPVNKFRDLVMESKQAMTDPHFSLAALAKEAGLVEKFQMDGPTSVETHYGGETDGANGRFGTYYCEHEAFGVVMTQQNDMVKNPPAVIDLEVSKAESEELWGPDCLDDPLPSDKFQKNKFTKWVYKQILTFEMRRFYRRYKNQVPPQSPDDKS